jgi:uncharacterized protein (DUF4415 family)
MNPQSRSDWARIKREAAADAPVPVTSDDLYDPENEAQVNAFWQGAKVTVRRRGHGKAPCKQLTAIRFDHDVLAGLRATGRGWQTRVNDAMREWLKAHPAG